MRLSRNHKNKTKHTARELPKDCKIQLKVYFAKIVSQSSVHMKYTRRDHECS